MLLLLPEIKSISYSPLPVSTLTELSLFVFYGINSVLLLYLIIIAQLKPLLASWVLKQLATLRLKEKEYLLHIDKPRWKMCCCQHRNCHRCAFSSHSHWRVNAVGLEHSSTQPLLCRSDTPQYDSCAIAAFLFIITACTVILLYDITTLNVTYHQTHVTPRLRSSTLVGNNLWNWISCR